MLWIDEEDTSVAPDVETNSIFDHTVQTHRPAPNVDPMQKYGGNVLAYTDAIDQTVGGVATNGVQLGYSTGVLSVRQRWQPLTGLVLMPPKTAELRIGSPYGRVGLNNRIQNLLLGTEYQEVSDLLPSQADIARSYTRPDGIGNA